MNRIFMSLVIIAILSVSIQAKEVAQHINLGANSSTINSQSGNGFDISYGATIVWDNGLLGAYDINYGQATINNLTVNNYGGDLKLGYKYNDIAVYGIGSGIKQSYNNVDGAGFGFGGGLEYTPFKHIGIGVDYKSYSMTSTANDYDFEVTKAYLKIMF